MTTRGTNKRDKDPWDGKDFWDGMDMDKEWHHFLKAYMIRENMVPSEPLSFEDNLDWRRMVRDPYHSLQLYSRLLKYGLLEQYIDYVKKWREVLLIHDQSTQLCDEIRENFNQDTWDETGRLLEKMYKKQNEVEDILEKMYEVDPDWNNKAVYFQ